MNKKILACTVFVTAIFAVLICLIPDQALAEIVTDGPHILVPSKHQETWLGDWGGFADGKVEWGWLVQKQKIEVDVGMSPPVKDYQFPVKLTMEYEQDEMYAGNQNVMVTMTVEPFNGPNLTEIVDRCGMKAEMGYFSKYRYPCWKTWRPGFCWTGWVGGNVGWDLGVDLEGNTAPIMENDILTLTDTQTTGFSGDVVGGAGLDVLSLGVKTKTQISFINGVFQARPFFIPVGTTLDPSRMPDEGNFTTRMMRKDGNKYVTTYGVDIPANMKPGELMQFILYNFRYYSDFKYYLSTFGVISLWEAPEAPIQNHTVKFATDEEKPIFYVTVVSHNKEPIADAGNDVTVEQGQIATFNAGLSRDPDGQIASYHWQFEGGENSNNQVFLFDTTNLPAGDFEMLLTITDNEGAVSTDTARIIITSPVPKPDLEASKIYFPDTLYYNQGFRIITKTGNYGKENVNGAISCRFGWRKVFNNGSRGAYHEVATPAIWGLDRLEKEEKTLSALAVGNSGTYVFIWEVDYNNRYDESNENNNILEKEVEITEVYNTSPQANITISADGRRTKPDGTKYWTAGDVVKISPEGSTDDYGIIDYEWDFDDGETDVDQHPAVHNKMFRDSGKYEVELTTVDRQGLDDEAEAEVIIIPPTPQLVYPGDDDITHNSILLKWTVGRDANLRYFMIMYHKDGAWQERVISKDAREFLVANLGSNLNYNFKISAVSKEKHGYSARSLSDNVTVRTEHAKPNLRPEEDYVAAQQDMQRQQQAGNVGANQQGGDGVGGVGGNDGMDMAQAGNNNNDLGELNGGQQVATPSKIYFKIRNVGTANIAGPSSFRVTAGYTSLNNQNITGNLVPIDFQERLILQNGLAVSGSAQVKFELPPQAGEYRICINVDTRDSVDELHEDDNLACMEFTTPTPDLTVEKDLWNNNFQLRITNYELTDGESTENTGMQSANTEGTGNEGGHEGAPLQATGKNVGNTFKFKIKNIGVASASSPIKVRGYYSYTDVARQQSVMGNMDGPTEIAQNIAMGSFSRVTYTIADEIDAPEIMVCVQVDPTNEISELVEDNNAHCFSHQKDTPNITVGVADGGGVAQDFAGNLSDFLSLETDEIEGLEQMEQQGIDKVVFKIVNDGTKNISGDIKLKAYVVKASILLSGPVDPVINLIGPEQITGLNVNQVKDLTYVIPDELKDNETYYLWIEADWDNQIVEKDETDNRHYVSYTREMFMGGQGLDLDLSGIAGVTPDSPFYWFEQATEKVKMTFTFNKEKKAKLHMRFALERVAEAQVMIQEDKDPSTRLRTEKKVADLMESFQDNVEQMNTNTERILTDHKSSGSEDKISTVVKQMAVVLRQQKAVLETISETVENESVKEKIADAIQKVQKQETHNVELITHNIEQTDDDTQHETHNIEQTDDDAMNNETTADADDELSEPGLSEISQIDPDSGLQDDDVDDDTTTDDEINEQLSQPEAGHTEGEIINDQLTTDDVINEQLSIINDQLTTDDDTTADDVDDEGEYTDSPLQVTNIFGCTDSSATNYNANATINDGLCQYPETDTDTETTDDVGDDTTADDTTEESVDIEGCTDLDATNYDSTATVDDGSCIYPELITDLSISASDVSISPSTIVSGEEFTVQVNVQNGGDTNVNGFSVDFYINSAVMETQDVAGLNSGAQTQNLEFSYIPTPGDSGTNTIGITVDSANAIDEDSENNNSVEINFTVEEALPDFVPSNLRVTQLGITPAEGYLLQVTVTNQGNATSYNDVDVVFYIDDVYYLNGPVSDLDAGESVNTANDLYWYPDPGTYQIKVIVDPESMISESNENNNEVTKLESL